MPMGTTRGTIHQAGRQGVCGNGDAEGVYAKVIVKNQGHG